LRVGIAQGLPLRGLDEAVTAKLFEAVSQFGQAGVQLTPELFPHFDDMARANARGSIAVAEAYAIHRDLMAARGAGYDPFVRERIERGGSISAADYITLIHTRERMVREMDTRLADLDAIVLPTVAIVAPTIAECRNPENALMRNAQVLRNSAIANFFNLCAISLPPPRGDGLPVGLMLAARNGRDRRLLRIAAAVEKLFAG
jgi:aspartyl-tRNA(Asn)/glutamyl-tRNA(Gln) amidotransferase subunit A